MEMLGLDRRKQLRARTRNSANKSSKKPEVTEIKYITIERRT